MQPTGNDWWVDRPDGPPNLKEFYALGRDFVDDWLRPQVGALHMPEGYWMRSKGLDVQSFPPIWAIADSFVIDSTQWGSRHFVIFKIAFEPATVAQVKMRREVSDVNVDGTLDTGDPGWRAMLREFRGYPCEALPCFRESHPAIWDMWAQYVLGMPEDERNKLWAVQGHEHFAAPKIRRMHRS